MKLEIERNMYKNNLLITHFNTIINIHALVIGPPQTRHGLFQVFLSNHTFHISFFSFVVHRHTKPQKEPLNDGKATIEPPIYQQVESHSPPLLL